MLLAEDCTVLEKQGDAWRLMEGYAPMAKAAAKGKAKAAAKAPPKAAPVKPPKMAGGGPVEPPKAAAEIPLVK